MINHLTSSDLCILVHLTCYLLKAGWRSSLAVTTQKWFRVHLSDSILFVLKGFMLYFFLAFIKGWVQKQPCSYVTFLHLSPGLGWCRILPGFHLWTHDRSCILHHGQERRYIRLLHHFPVPCPICPLPGDYWYPVCSSNVSGNTASGEKGKIHTLLEMIQLPRDILLSSFSTIGKIIGTRHPGNTLSYQSCLTVQVWCCCKNPT